MTIVTDVEFNDQKYYLGQLCPQQHDYNGAKYSLRFRSDRSCLYCRREAEARKRKLKQQKAAEADLLLPTKLVDHILFNADLHFLGHLCPQRHDQDGTRQTLRFRSNSHCVYCQRKVGIEYRANNREQINHRQRARYIPGQYNEVYKQYYRDNFDKIVAYRSTPEYKEKEKMWRKNKRNPERAKYLAKMSRRRREARKRAALFEPYTTSEIALRFDQFDGCAYCGKYHPNLTNDHVVALARLWGSGTDRLENLVPACPSCNYSKHNHPLILWFVSKQKIFDLGRLNKILSLLGELEYALVVEDYFRFKDKIEEKLMYVRLNHSSVLT